MTHSDWAVLVSFIVACYSASAVGAVFRPGAWYQGLAKPRWRPPNWLFAPVWTALYAMIAVSGWLVWREACWLGATLPLGLYVLQLALNAAWPPIFFGLRRIGFALVEIAVLWLAIVSTMIAFFPFSTLAVWLLVPYLVWISFATALTYAIWRLNRRAA